MKILIRIESDEEKQKVTSSLVIHLGYDNAAKCLDSKIVYTKF